MVEDPHRRRANRVNATTSYASRVIALFGFYGCAQAEINARGFDWAIDPQMVNWEFSAHERAVWEALCARGMKAYPHYPIGRFYVDFALVGARLAIECDGAAYQRDWDKDGERNAQLMTRGWTVLRISRHDCMVDNIDPSLTPLSLLVNRVQELVRQRKAEAEQKTMSLAARSTS